MGDCKKVDNFDISVSKYIFILYYDKLIWSVTAKHSIKK